jgi:hypothetical protein
MDYLDFISKLKEVANDYKTVYMWGCFGSPVTEATITRMANQYPDWYTFAKVKRFRALIGKNYFAFDCVNLIKAILWGWDGNSDKTYGGASYTSNGIPDVSANGMLKKLTDVSANFSDIEVCEAVWMEGHIGVYIGNGKCIECTPIWDDGVQVTACGNIGKIRGLHTRTWIKHGKMPYIDYSKTKTTTKEEIKVTANTKTTTTATDGNTPSSWAEEAVKKAQAKGLLKGDSNSNLKLQDAVTREQLMVFFNRLELLN